MIRSLLSNQIFLAVIFYAATTLPFLALTIAVNGNGNQNLILPFALFLYPSFAIVFPPAGPEPSILSVGVYISLLFAFSMITYPLHACLPERVPRPYSGPMGFALAIVLIPPLFYVINRIKPDDSNSTGE